MAAEPTKRTVDWSRIIERVILAITLGMLFFTARMVFSNREKILGNSHDIESIDKSRFTKDEGSAHLVMITENRMAIKATQANIAEMKIDIKEMLRMMHAREK